MDVRHVILVIFGLVARFYCDSTESTTGDTSTIGETTVSQDQVTTTQQTVTEEASFDLNLGYRGLYGGTYYNSRARNPSNLHYIHGTFQPPRKNYYRRQNYYRDGGSDETFDYYLGFAITKMTDDDFQYDDFHYYYHDINRTISDNETIPSDWVIACHPNATSFCPENAETVCLLNGTIFCMTQIDVVVPCSLNESVSCVNSVVPCVRGCVDVDDNFEEISLPCLSTVVIVDVNEKNGKTLSKVGGTFVIMDAIEEKKRTFCITVILDPKDKQRKD